MRSAKSGTGPRHGSTWIVVVLLFWLAPPIAAQDEKPPLPRDDRSAIERGADLIVTAARANRSLHDVAASVTVVDEERLRERVLISALDALDDQIGIWVEKRTQSTSDIVLRGLSGGNILALIDGSTLSTFWGEGGFAGDDMYGKVDGESIERIEVLRGPASLRYGANALGGVVNFITKSSPFDYNEGELELGGRLRAYYASAADEWSLREEFYGAYGDFRWIVGATQRASDDVRSPHRTQEPTSGEEWNFDGKFQFRLSENDYLTVSVQDVNRDHLHRYYRPTQDNFNDRTGVNVLWEREDLDLFFADRMSFKVYYQSKKDVRRFFDGPVKDGTSNLTAIGIAEWDTFQTSLVLERDLDAHRIVYGIDYEVTWGESPDDEQFTIYPKNGGAVTKPAPDSTWQGIGFFITDEWTITDWFEIQGGIRLQAYLFSTDVDGRYVDPGGQPELANIDEDEFTATGALSLLFHPDENTDVWLTYSRGFRQFAPNFGIVKLGFGVLVPNGFLDPVTSDTIELGFRTDQESWGAEGAFYYSDFGDFQNRVSGTFNGQSFYDFDGDGNFSPDEAVIMTSANGNAYVYGVELWAWMKPDLLIWDGIPRGFTLGAGFMYNYGQDETNDEPLRHTHPIRGIVKLRYEEPDEARWYAEVSADIVGRYDRIPPGRLLSDPGYRSDPQDPNSPLLRDYGLPGYTVYDFRAGYRFCEKARMDFGVENFTDKKYRGAHSRWDAAGINAYVSLEVRF